MISKLYGVLQVILIQVISAQLSHRDLASQNVLNTLANTPPAGYGRSRRQIDNPPVGDPGNKNLPVNGFANSLPFGNLPRSNILKNSFELNNGFPNNLAFNYELPHSFGHNSGMALPNNSPFNLPFSNMNIAPQNSLLPNVNDININGLPINIPNGLPSFNHVPNALPNSIFMPNALPNFNIMPNVLPGFNNVPNALPTFNNMPYPLPSLNNVLNVLPSLNNVPNGLPNINNLPFPNKFQNLNIEPFGKNNLPAANSLSNINNMPILNGLPSFNNLQCRNALPPLQLRNGLPLNSLASDNLLEPKNNQLPYFGNFRVTEIGIGNGVSDINRFPRNGLPNGIMLPIANNLQSGDGFAQQISDELSNINNYQNQNGFSGVINYTPPASTLKNNVPVDNRFSSIDNFPKDSSVSNFAVEAQNINNMQFNNDLQDIRNFHNFNVMPVNEQRFLNNVPFNNGFADAINFPADVAKPNANSRLVNAINSGIPLSNGGYLNDIFFANNGMALNIPETYIQNSDDNGFSSNNFQFGNAQVPVNNHDFEGAKMPANQNLLPEGVQMFSNVPSDYQSVLMPNNLNLAQELVKNLKIEGNMPFLNGLPVAGITETVTVLNGPSSK